MKTGLQMLMLLQFVETKQLFFFRKKLVAVDNVTNSTHSISSCSCLVYFPPTGTVYLVLVDSWRLKAWTNLVEVVKESQIIHRIWLQFQSAEPFERKQSTWHFLEVNVFIFYSQRTWKILKQKLFHKLLEMGDLRKN